MKQKTKIFTKLLVVLFSALFVFSSCKKDKDSDGYVYQKTWVITAEENAICLDFASDGVMSYGMSMSKEIIAGLQSMAGEGSTLPKDAIDFIKGLKEGEFVCFKGSYTASSDCTDESGTLSCYVLKHTMTFIYKVLSETSMLFTLSGESSGETAVAKKVTLKYAPDSIEELFEKL